MESVVLPDQVAYVIGACMMAVESAVAVPAVPVGVPQILETWEEKLKIVSEILAKVIPMVCPQAVGLWVSQDSSKAMIQYFFAPS